MSVALVPFPQNRNHSTVEALHIIYTILKKVFLTVTISNKLKYNPARFMNQPYLGLRPRWSWSLFGLTLAFGLICMFIYAIAKTN